MRKKTLLLAGAVVALLSHPGAASGLDAERLDPRTPGAAEAPLIAAGGTPFSNGIFLPGTLLCVGSTCSGEPMVIARGTDVRLYNLDPAVVANTHGIVSKARKKSGEPLFVSAAISGPGNVLVKTSHLRAGVYEYQCRVHGPMMGIIEVTP